MDAMYLAALREAKGDRTTTREIIEHVRSRTGMVHRVDSKMYYMAYTGNTALLTQYRDMISSGNGYQAAVLYVYALESGNAVLARALKPPWLNGDIMDDVRSPAVFNALCGEYRITPLTLGMLGTTTGLVWSNATRVLETATSPTADVMKVSTC